MVSIFERFPKFGWRLPVTYKPSPCLDLDYPVVNTKHLILNGNEKDDGLCTVTEDEVLIKRAPRKQCSKKTKTSSCRTILNQIKSLTYLVHDIDTLYALEYKLKVSLDLLKNGAPKEEGDIVQSLKVKRKVKQLNIRDEIPKAERIKSSLTGRVGVKAEQIKLPSNLIISNLIKEPVTQILEKVAPAGNAMYDIPMQKQTMLTILVKL